MLHDSYTYSEYDKRAVHLLINRANFEADMYECLPSIRILQNSHPSDNLLQEN